MSKKGTPKNTVNKAKHTKLMSQKANRLRKKKELRAIRLKEIAQRVKEAKENNAQ